MTTNRARVLRFLVPVLLAPLLAGCIAILGGCIAVVVGGGGLDTADEGWIGPGGSMSIAIGGHWPFEMAVSEAEVTLLVQDRTIVLPHTNGGRGVRYEDFDYDDREIRMDLGGGVEARIDGIRLRVGERRYVLEQPGTYHVDVAGGGYTFTAR
ncbi:MAG: hypothetical protein AB1726_05500 [Planctomycetota bacterium]